MTLDLVHRLKKAVELLDEAGVPQDLREAAFVRTFDALRPPLGPTVSPRAGSGANHDLSTGDDSMGLLAKVAAKLQLNEEIVARVFEESDGEVRLIVRRSMLPEPTKKAASMRAVALLVVVGRQTSGLEDQTSLAIVREECADLGVFDSNNFAAEVGKLDFKLSGTGRARDARSNRHHHEEAARLIKTICGEGDAT